MEVLVKNESTAPTRWPLGRIMEVHPGIEEKKTVVILKVQGGIFKRPIKKLCPLKMPGRDNEEKPAVVNLTTTRPLIQKRNSAFKML